MPQHIKIFCCICNILSLINIILCILILPIIIRNTLHSMQVYKRLLISYVIAQILFDLWSLLFKHTMLSPLNVIITVGYLQEYANPTLTIIGFNGFLTFIMLLGDILLCLFIERYYAITKNVIDHGRYRQVCLYGGIVATHLILVTNGVLAFTTFGHLYSKDGAIKYMYRETTDPGLLLTQQIPCITDLFSKLSISTFATCASLLVYLSTRGLGFLYFTYQNIKCLKGAPGLNANIRRHNTTIIKTLVIQLLTMFLFFGVPASIGASIVTFRLPLPLVYLYLQCNYHIYPICDLVVTVMMIKPYRMALIKFFSTTCSLLTGPKYEVSPAIVKSAFN